MECIVKMELPKRIKINNRIYYLKAKEFPGSEYCQFSFGYFDDNDEIAECESGYLTDFKKQIDKFGKPKMKTTMIGKVIDVEIDGRIISGEVVKEDKDSVLIDMNGDLKRVFKTDLP